MIMRLSAYLIALIFTTGVFTLAAWAGPYSDQLRTDTPHSGRFIAEDGESVNLANQLRKQPINISRGEFEGAQPFIAYGQRTTAGAETDFPIWPDGVLSLAPYGSGVTVQSTSVNDTANGTGIQAVYLHYLRQDLTVVDDLFIELNGTTPVPINDPSFYFAQCMHVVPGRVGSGLKAAGNITIKNGAGTATYSIIPTGKLRCSSSYRMVPKGKRLFIDTAVASSVSATADTTTLIAIVSNWFEGHYYKSPMLMVPYASVGAQNNAISATFPGGIGPLPEGAVVGCTHTTNKAATVSCDWFGRLEPAE